MASDFYAALGANIRKRREKLGLTQDQLAGEIGLSRTSIVNIEAGRQGIAVHQFVDISESLAVAPGVLLKGIL